MFVLLQSKWWDDDFVLRLCVYACGCAWPLHTTRKHDALIRLLCRYKMSNRLINWDTWCTVYSVSELASLFCWWNYSYWKRVLHFCCFFWQSQLNAFLWHNIYFVHITTNIQMKYLFELLTWSKPIQSTDRWITNIIIILNWKWWLVIK